MKYETASEEGVDKLVSLWRRSYLYHVCRPLQLHCRSSILSLSISSFHPLVWNNYRHSSDWPLWDYLCQVDAIPASSC